jgi:hypothetical protein
VHGLIRVRRCIEYELGWPCEQEGPMAIRGMGTSYDWLLRKWVGLIGIMQERKARIIGSTYLPSLPPHLPTFLGVCILTLCTNKKK